MRLRFDEARNQLKLTHPRSVSRRAALAWAASQREWVEEQMASVLPAEPFAPGALIPFDGDLVELCWVNDGPRSARMETGRIVCGGASGGFERSIRRFLVARALETLSAETAEMAGRAGVRPTAVSVGDAATRWGSCSSSGKIRYSWRLMLAPPDVRRLVVAHEVAHLVHLDHGAEFKALEELLFGGDPADARALLRKIGPRLKRIGLS